MKYLVGLVICLHLPFITTYLVYDIVTSFRIMTALSNFK